MIKYQIGGVTPAYSDSLELYLRSVGNAEEIAKNRYQQFLDGEYPGVAERVQDSLIERFIFPSLQGRPGFEKELDFPGAIKPVGNTSYKQDSITKKIHFLPFFAKPSKPVINAMTPRSIPIVTDTILQPRSMTSGTRVVERKQELPSSVLHPRERVKKPMYKTVPE